MEEYQIKIKKDGKEVSEEQIRQTEIKSYQKVFREFDHKNIPILLDGKWLSADEVENLELSQMKKALGQTKENIGRSNLRRLYEQELKSSDEIWKNIADNSREKENLQPIFVEAEVTGISLQQFMVCNHEIAKINNLKLPSEIHPEHYSFETGTGGNKISMERIGLQENPAWILSEIAKDRYYPVKPDADTTLSVVWYTKLMSDKSDTKLVGMHQFKQTENGMNAKLGMFYPEAAPKAMLEEQQWHMIVEVYNLMHYAYGLKPKKGQAMAVNAAVHYAKRKNHIRQ